MKTCIVLIVAATVSFLVLSGAGPAQCERTMFLSVCQEQVNAARMHEARSAAHNQIAKNLMVQIEQMAKLPKNPATISAIDRLFQQYEENRALERKFRELYRESSEQAKQCMKAVE